ncbi:hypothetical protein [Metapseudomonas furukawaii]|nr:hypothetical protein [Pseudomonas furukawaii]
MAADLQDELIRELAAKHGVVLGRDDPILMLTTIQEHMLRKLNEGQSEALAEFQRTMELSMTTWSEDAREKAQRIVNGALEASKRVMAQNAEAAAAEFGKVLERKVGEMEVRLNAAREERSSTLVVVSIASGLALVVAVVGLFI